MKELGSLFIRLDKEDSDLKKYFLKVNRNARPYKAKELLRVGIAIQQKFEESIFNQDQNTFSTDVNLKESKHILEKTTKNTKDKPVLKIKELSKEEKKKMLENKLNNF